MRVDMMKQPLSIILVVLYLASAGAARAWSPLDAVEEARSCRSVVAGGEEDEQSEPPTDAQDDQEPDCE